MNENTPIKNQNTKDRILDTALDLFANNGFHKTSISQIAKTTGVSKSLVYNYFESKNQLLESIITTFIERNAQLLPSGSIENLESPEDLAEYLQKLKLHFVTHSTYYRLLIMLTLQGTVKEIIMPDILEKQRVLLPQLNAFFHKFHQEDSDKLTYLLGAVMDGIFLHYLYMEGNYPLDEIFDYFSNRLKAFLQQQ